MPVGWRRSRLAVQWVLPHWRGDTDSPSWPTCWPLQKSIRHGSGYSKNAFCLYNHASGIAQDFISTYVDTLTEKKKMDVIFLKNAKLCPNNHRIKFCVRDQQLLAVLPPEKWIINQVLIMTDMEGALLCQYCYPWQS